MLDLDEVGYEAPTGHRSGPRGRPVLEREGTVSWRGRTVDVAREGLPTMDAIELPAGRDSEGGRFLLVATSRVRRPARERLLVAVTLAEQVVVPAPDRGGSSL